MPSSGSAFIDSFDRSILEIVQESNRVTSEKISEQVGLSPAAVQRRLKRMRDDGIIQADISVINSRKIGREMTFVVQVSLERERADLMHTFKKEMTSNKAVQQCYYVTGSSDFILIVTSFDMVEYYTFVHYNFLNNTNIRSFQTNVVMDAVKVGLSIPVDEKPTT
jgi:Lrp/AsnC family leucine-responsive transcriptional regulator